MCLTWKFLIPEMLGYFVKGCSVSVTDLYEFAWDFPGFRTESPIKSLSWENCDHWSPYRFSL